MSNVGVSLTLSLSDRISAAMRRTLASVRQEFRYTEQSAAGVENRIRSTNVTAKLLFDTLQRGRATGIQHINTTAAAANAQVTRLHKNVESLMSRMTRLGRGAFAGVAGLQAGKFILKEPVSQTQSYELRMAHLANTAFNERDTAGRRAGMMQMDAAVTSAVRTGGGTRESAADTLDALVASGAFNIADAIKLLPTLQRGATASNADPRELAQIAVTSMQTFGIKTDQLAQVLDMAVRAGQLGGFEIKDMAQWLPQQMAAARTAGMSGINDFGRLLASNQAAVLTAGTKDMAGNNLVNLLAKINSRDTQEDARKLGYNLAGSLAEARGKGMNPMDAFVAFVEKQVVGRDAKYQALRKQAAAAPEGSERRATLSSMADILQGSGIGKIIQDRQALMQLVAEMEGRAKVQEVLAGIAGNRATGAVSGNFATVQSTTAFKVQEAANEKAIAMQRAMDKVNPALGSLAENATAAARAHPEFTAGLVAATTALFALATAAGVAGVATVLTRGGAKGAAGAAASGAGTAAAAGAGAAAASLLTKAKVATALTLGAPSMSAIAASGATGIATAGAYGVGALAGGYGYGTGANAVMNWMVSQVKGYETSIGSELAGVVGELKEWISRPQNIVVDVRNGNIVAEVERRQQQDARRK